MAHGYRTLQHWNRWLAQAFLGKILLDAEKEAISHLLDPYFGKHALLIGVSHQQNLLTTLTNFRFSLISPFTIQEKKWTSIEGDFHKLPILSGTIDLVILPHTLEWVDSPRQLLGEACRIIKPEGLIIICGFNPYSAWGLKKLVSKQKIIPWEANFIHLSKVKNWLKLADFQIEKFKPILFTPPINHPALYQKLRFLESLGSKCFLGLSGVYILMARAKVIPLTPIRLKWKQQLGGIRISGISGHVA